MTIGSKLVFIVVLAAAVVAAAPFPVALAGPGDVVPTPLDVPGENDGDSDVGEQMC